ncbi:hypothetical protein OC835_007560 [Tilletia horrida]|nr:hypothetical protein OC835_007560 [Tilletia horrida]
MPLRAPGDMKLLGGEFIFGPGLQCSFVHRMVTTRGHLDVPRILSQAGIDMTPSPEKLKVPIPPIPADEEHRDKDLPARPHSINSFSRSKRIARNARSLLRKASITTGNSEGKGRERRTTGPSAWQHERYFSTDASNGAGSSSQLPKMRNHSTTTLDRAEDFHVPDGARSWGRGMSRGAPEDRLRPSKSFGPGGLTLAEAAINGGRLTPTQQSVLQAGAGDAADVRRGSSASQGVGMTVPRPISKDGPQRNGRPDRAPITRITSFAQHDLMAAALQPMARGVAPGGNGSRPPTADQNGASPRTIQDEDDGAAANLHARANTGPALSINVSADVTPSASPMSSRRVSPVSAAHSGTFGADAAFVQGARAGPNGGFYHSAPTTPLMSSNASRPNLHHPLPSPGDNPANAFAVSAAPQRDASQTRKAAAGLGHMDIQSSDTFDANGSARAAAAAGGGGFFLDDLQELDGLVIRTPSPEHMQRQSEFGSSSRGYISEEEEEEEEDDDDDYDEVDMVDAGDDSYGDHDDGDDRVDLRHQRPPSRQSSSRVRGYDAYDSGDDDVDSEDSDVLGSRSSSRATLGTPDLVSAPAPAPAAPAPAPAPVLVDRRTPVTGWVGRRPSVAEHVIEEEDEEDEEPDEEEEEEEEARLPVRRFGGGEESDEDFDEQTETMHTRAAAARPHEQARATSSHGAQSVLYGQRSVLDGRPSLEGSVDEEEEEDIDEDGEVDSESDDDDDDDDGEDDRSRNDAPWG